MTLYLVLFRNSDQLGQLEIRNYSMLLSIIILNYNTKDLVVQALNSITCSRQHEIIIVDNGSTDGSAGFFRKKFPNHRLITSNENLGFAGGNNLGLTAATGQYILLLNSDTVIIDRAIDKCLAYLDQHPLIGILTPKLTLTDGSVDLACHRGAPTIWNSLTYFTKMEKIFPGLKIFSGYHQLYKGLDSIHQIDATSGAAMFIRAKVIKDIGLLDERFFMYAEDLDFCYRARQQGWQIVYYPQSRIQHLKGQSGTKHNDKQLQTQTKHYFYSTMKQYYDKHQGPGHPQIVRWITHQGIDVIEKLKR
jgi:GT2 family glycosyltransferase